MKEIRKLSMESLRRACIDNDWYTMGNNEEYSNILTKAQDLENVTTKDLEEIAEDIYVHSYITNKENDNVKYIMTKLLKYCYTYID